MNKISYIFYECNNPECRLRFPGYDEYPRWKLCPICRSKIHTVALVEYTTNMVLIQDSVFDVDIGVMLDNIRSAYNVGSILRTADGIGIRNVYLCGITPTPENLNVQKTSLEAEQNTNWHKYNNGLITASELKGMGYHLWALETIPAAESLFTIDILPSDSPIVLIVGNEVAGIDPGIIDLCERIISIPMFGKKGSYNVTIAFGIAAIYMRFRSIQHNHAKTR